jgi:hypothetical protein
VDNAEFFEYNLTGSEKFDALVISGSPDVVSAGVSAVVSAAGTIQSLVINSSGSGYTGNSVVAKISSPPRVIEINDEGVIVSVGSNATATIAVGVGGTLTTPIIIINPGFGYTTSNPPQVLVPLPDPIYENLSEISTVNGFSGTITGIGTTTGSGGNSLALRFTLKGPVGFSGLQVGYPIYISDTRVGNGVTSINSSNSAVVGVGTTFIDNIYYIHQFTSSGPVGIITCNIRSNTSVVGLASTGNVLNAVGKFSWGRMYGFTRSSFPISIGVTGNNVDAELSNFPTIQRRGAGIRDTGALPKIIL